MDTDKDEDVYDDGDVYDIEIQLICSNGVNRIFQEISSSVSVNSLPMDRIPIALLFAAKKLIFKSLEYIEKEKEKECLNLFTQDIIDTIDKKPVKNFPEKSCKE